MIDEIPAHPLRRRARQLERAAIALIVIVAAQVVILEMVLRSWQNGEAATVFAGIGASALLCAFAVTIFLRTRRRCLR